MSKQVHGELLQQLQTPRKTRYGCRFCGWSGSGDDLVDDGLANYDMCPGCGRQASFLDHYIYRVEANLQEGFHIACIGFCTQVFLYVEADSELQAKYKARVRLQSNFVTATSMNVSLAEAQHPDFYPEVI